MAANRWCTSGVYPNAGSGRQKVFCGGQYGLAAVNPGKGFTAADERNKHERRVQDALINRVDISAQPSTMCVATRVMAFRCVVPKNNTPLCSVEKYAIPNRGDKYRGIRSTACLLLFAAWILVLRHRHDSGPKESGCCRLQASRQVRYCCFRIDPSSPKTSGDRESSTSAAWPILHHYRHRWATPFLGGRKDSSPRHPAFTDSVWGLFD